MVVGIVDYRARCVCGPRRGVVVGWGCIGLCLGVGVVDSGVCEHCDLMVSVLCGTWMRPSLSCVGVRHWCARR
jgi:hypothetical protein